MYIYIYIYIYTCIYVGLYSYIHIYTCMCTCTFTYIGKYNSTLLSRCCPRPSCAFLCMRVYVGGTDRGVPMLPDLSVVCVSICVCAGVIAVVALCCPTCPRCTFLCVWGGKGGREGVGSGCGVASARVYRRCGVYIADAQTSILRIYCVL